MWGPEIFAISFRDAAGAKLLTSPPISDSTGHSESWRRGPVGTAWLVGLAHRPAS